MTIVVSYIANPHKAANNNEIVNINPISHLYELYFNPSLIIPFRSPRALEYRSPSSDRDF